MCAIEKKREREDEPMWYTKAALAIMQNDNVATAAAATRISIKSNGSDLSRTLGAARQTY